MERYFSGIFNVSELYRQCVTPGIYERHTDQPAEKLRKVFSACQQYVSALWCVKLIRQNEKLTKHPDGVAHQEPRYAIRPPSRAGARFCN